MNQRIRAEADHAQITDSNVVENTLLLFPKLKKVETELQTPLQWLSSRARKAPIACNIIEIIVLCGCVNIILWVAVLVFVLNHFLLGRIFTGEDCCDFVP